MFDNRIIKTEVGHVFIPPINQLNHQSRIKQNRAIAKYYEEDEDMRVSDELTLRAD